MSDEHGDSCSTRGPFVRSQLVEKTVDASLTDPLTLILSSGGTDSTTALALALAEGANCETLFVDYGQAAAAAESRASKAVANHYRVRRRTLRLKGLSFASGEIRARNAFLLHAALLAFPREVGSVLIAVHAGTPYRDCRPEFVDEMQRSFDFHAGGAITIAAPFIDTSKGGVLALALDLSVPVGLTYSCEAANTPCGECLSCLDREALLARP